MKTFWNPLPYQTKSVPFSLGDGVNNGLPCFDIKDTELTDALNIDSRNYPAVKVRDGRSEVFNSIASVPRMLSQRNNNQLMMVDINAWFVYDGTKWVALVADLALESAKTEDFATGTSKYTIFSNGIDRYYYDGTTTTALTAMPPTKYFTVKSGRIYALKDNELSYCALNLITDWTTADDAGKISITNIKGPGTACETYGNKVIAWSEYSMHELYGTGPKNYTLVDVSLDIGCSAYKSVKEVGGRLFWLGRTTKGSAHIFSYTGGTLPSPVSLKVQGYLNRINWSQISKVVAGTDGRRYYIALPLDSSTDNNIILVYDTMTGNWYPESGNIVDFTEMNGVLYGIDTSGKIYDMINGTTDNGNAISWYLVSKPFNENNLANKKSWHRLNLVVKLPVGSTLSCALSNDAEGDNFTTVYTFTANSNLQNQEISIPIDIAQKADWVRLKLSGTGPCTIYKMEKQLRIVGRSR